MTVADRPAKAHGSLKVLAVINALGEGGTERSMAELVPHLETRGIDLTIATLRSRGDEGVEPWLRERGTDIRLLPSGAGRWPAFRRLVHQLEPDVVHSMLFEADLLARVGDVGAKTRVMTSLVNTSYDPARIAALEIPKAKFRVVQTVDAVTGRLLVDRFHAVSEAAKADAVDHLQIPAGRITVVHRGRHDPRPSIPPGSRGEVRGALGIPADARVLVNIGRHEFQKDHATLVRAVGPMLEARPDVWLLIAGRDGSETAELEGELARLPDASRILLLGHRSDVVQVLDAADVYVMTSRYEGLPGAVLEAMGVGLPVVGSDIGPVREATAVGDTALVAPIGDAPAFRQALESLLDDDELRSSMGKRGRERFEKHFEIEPSADRMVDLYREVAALPRRVLRWR